MAKKIYTRAETEDELRKMTDAEAKAYFNICKMNARMIQSDADRIQNEMHLEIMTAILFERTGKPVYYLLERENPDSIWGRYITVTGRMGLSVLTDFERRVSGYENLKIAYSSVDGRKVRKYFLEQFVVVTK